MFHGFECVGHADHVAGHAGFSDSTFKVLNYFVKKHRNQSFFSI